MVVSPFIVYNGTTAVDIRKSTMWALAGAVAQVYTRCTPGIPQPVVAATFVVAKQADVDASSFVK